MIIFVGSKIDGNFASEVAKNRNIEIVFVDKNSDITKQTNDILFTIKTHETPTHIIYDADQYNNDAEEIADEIIKIKNHNNAKPIVATISLHSGNVLVRACMDAGIKNFVNLSRGNFERKDALEKILTGYSDTNEFKEIETIKRIREEEKQHFDHFKKIGVAGTSYRIGTTTQAIQIAKYLKSKGYKVCYVEANSNEYINKGSDRRKVYSFSYVEKLKEYIEYDRENKELGIVTYDGIDMAYDPEKIALIHMEDYDYFIYDYGVYTGADFNKTSFLKDDIKILVGGSDVAELDYTMDAAGDISYACANIIFSFTAKEEQDGILKLFIDCKNKPERCYFASYTPSAFILSDVEMYDQLLNVSEKNIEETVIKKKKPFWRRKNDKQV